MNLERIEAENITGSDQLDALMYLAEYAKVSVLHLQALQGASAGLLFQEEPCTSCSDCLCFTGHCPGHKVCQTMCTRQSLYVCPSMTVKLCLAANWHAFLQRKGRRSEICMLHYRTCNGNAAVWPYICWLYVSMAPQDF